MPTQIVAVGSCWGIDQIGENFQLLDPITMILDFPAVNFSNITTLTAYQTLLIAAPTLYEFLKEDESVSISYNQLQEILEFALVHRDLPKPDTFGQTYLTY